MDDTNNGIVIQKPKTSKWAKRSLWFAYFGWLIGIGLTIVLVMIEVVLRFEEFGDNRWIGYVVGAVALLSPLSIIVALVTAVIGLVEIINKRGTVKGKGCTAISFLLIMPYLAMVSLPPYIAYMKSPPIHRAAGAGDIAKVKLLLAKKPKLINHKNLSGRTPLYAAINTGDCNMIKFLLENGADINIKPDYGDTPLMAAVSKTSYSMGDNYSEDKAVVELLIEKGAEMNMKGVSGRTALHIAAESKNREMVEFLINKGADVNAKTNEGETPLDVASKRGNIYVAELLCEHGGIGKIDCAEYKRSRGEDKK